MNNDSKVDAKFVPAQHYEASPNHDLQWYNDGITPLQVVDIPQIIIAMKEALDKFNYDAVCKDMANRYELNILNPDAFKMLVYANAMNAVAKLAKILVDSAAKVSSEFWLDETWLQADIAFTLPIHCRLRKYPDEQLKAILEYIPVSTSISGVERH